ncbi:MAG: hypothetical protein JO176_00940 [Acidimicrobiia bacterium]|nr:hypothetical protein [Acidimicrobiia bacterium]
MQQTVHSEPDVASDTVTGAPRRRVWLWGTNDPHIAEESWLLRGIVVLQLVAVLGVAVLTLTSFEIWARLDEHAHYDYVETIADQHVLPNLRAHGKPGQLEMGRHTYEAFQPPLYYLAAAPLLKLSHVEHTRVLILRTFDLLLLLGALYATWRLAVVVFPDRPLWPFAFGLMFFLLPGVIVRSITISYQPLATLLSVVFLALLFKADRAPRDEANRWFLAAAFTFGLAMLTTLLTAPLGVMFGIVALRRLWRDRAWRTVGVFAACGVMLVALLAPWLAFNEAHYGSLTSFSTARTLQQPLINPDNHNYTVSEAPRIARVWIREAFLPNEWVVFVVTDHALDQVISLMFYLLVLLPVLLVIVRPRTLLVDSAWYLALPLAISIVFLEATTITANWPTFARYLYGAGPAWLLFVYVAVRQALRHWAAPMTVLALGTAGAGCLWIQAGVRYF